MKVTHLTLKDMTILPPQKDTCPECGVKHPPEAPHNRDSLYYQYKFMQQHDRWPTWTDAMAHCSPEVKAAWKQALKQHGIEVEELEGINHEEKEN